MSQQEKKTLLLINPVSTVRKGFSQDLTSKYPPLALGMVAAATPADEWKIYIIDENFNKARVRHADLVGITAYTENADRAYEVAAMYREHGIPVVMGGIHASMCSGEARKYVDTVVVGEAELTWPQLLEDFKQGRMQPIYRAIGYADLAKLPPARHDLFHPSYWHRIIQTSRGCPYDCDFCTVTAFNGRIYRARPVENILDEIEQCQGKYSSFIFADDNLIGNTPAQRQRALDLFKGIVARGIKIDWFSQVTVDVAEYPDLLHWARKSGCRILLVGIEAETMEGLDSMNKIVNKRKGGISYYKKAFKTINKHGISVLGTFILGLEGDTEQDIRNRAKFIVKSRVDAVQCSILTPFPGTKLHKRLEQNGQIACDNFPDDWHHFRFMDLAYFNKQMKPSVMADEIEKAWRKIYSRPLIVYKLFRTWLATGSFVASWWAFEANIRYRRDVLEKPVRRDFSREFHGNVDKVQERHS
ncbi:MAG TPA: B12-binding domain-containing radical SAM protein [Bacteroidales bacterium]|nr:MAG: hypothetical protein A2X11_05355 [Bacteroidetes bacterium GWE2_42_24]OFY26557.1 MAG: hypothetical protein A2X09_03210 [Bacteroidetes bacterium GWF2_43_11]PKP27616.1 MAG: B12-binding domain-containing radical SAM protein [Bacteroidetes bacterium HGW-Bacteroidetes-22]HBZ67434.1 B12-binding domain-containing radical SAM protein [Bacteroidales bacterium]